MPAKLEEEYRLARKVKPVWCWNSDYDHLNHDERYGKLDQSRFLRSLGNPTNNEYRPQDDPEIAVSSVLWNYCDLAFRPQNPSHAERREVIFELAKRANHLNEALQKTGDNSINDLQYGVGQALQENDPQSSAAVSETQNNDADLAKCESDRFWASLENFGAFSELLSKAALALPTFNEPTKRGAKPNTALHEAILSLAGIFEDNVGVSAYDKFSLDENGIASNSFMSFLDETIVKYDPEVGKNKVALGALVRRLLAPK